MGYRSDVAYIIEFKSFEDRDAYITLMLAKNEPALNNAIEEVEDDSKDRPIVTFKAECVKWYDDFPSVRAHTYLFRQAHGLFGADYLFIAIGEDGREDLELEQSFTDLTDDLYAVHKIETSF